MKHVLKALNKKLTFCFSSRQNSLTTTNSAYVLSSANRLRMGQNEFFTPFASKWERYLLLSRKRLRVCWGDILKCLEMQMVRNYRAFVASLIDFLLISAMSTFRAFYVGSLRVGSFAFSSVKKVSILASGYGSQLVILLFSACQRLYPICFNISAMMPQLYNRIAGVELSLRASNFFNFSSSFLFLRMDRKMTAKTNPSISFSLSFQLISMRLFWLRRASLTRARPCSHLKTSAPIYNGIVISYQIYNRPVKDKDLLFYLSNIKEFMEPEPKHQGKFQKLQAQVDPQLRLKWEAEQHKIRTLIQEKNSFGWDLNTLDLVAGVDISASKHDNDIACAALVIYSCKLKTDLYEETLMFNISHQPYIPGFLAFREVPVLWELFNKLKAKQPQLWPELVLVDGNGILHQNQCGLACHLGVLLDLPTIGVGKTLFYIDGLGKEKVKAQCEKEIKEAGDISILVGDSGRAWGAAVRNSKGAVNPIFVSIGHKIELNIAVQCILKLSLFRVVEPIRLADKRSRELVQGWKGDKAVLPAFEMVYLDK